MKKLLVIRVTKDVLDLSVKQIFCNALHYDIEPVFIDVSNSQDLRDNLENKKYDYIYFAGHGDENYFSDNKQFTVNWSEIGEIICETDCLNSNAIILLYCCKGGLSTVAYKLIAECDKISYVCGAKQNMTNIDLIIGFDVFIYNIESRNIDPVLSAQKATLATDIRFECFDRIDVESNPNFYYNYCKDCQIDEMPKTIFEKFRHVFHACQVFLPRHDNN